MSRILSLLGILPFDSKEQQLSNAIMHLETENRAFEHYFSGASNDFDFSELGMQPKFDDDERF